MRCTLLMLRIQRMHTFYARRRRFPTVMFNFEAIVYGVEQK